MAIHSSILAWKIPWTEEPGRLQSMGSQSQTRLSNFTFTFPGSSDGKESACQLGRPGFDPWIRKIPWRRQWHPTPVLLPGKSHGLRSLVGYSPFTFYHLSCCCCCSVAKQRLTLCDPMKCSIPGFLVLHHLLEFAQTHVH